MEDRPTERDTYNMDLCIAIVERTSQRSSLMNHRVFVAFHRHRLRCSHVMYKTAKTATIITIQQKSPVLSHSHDVRDPVRDLMTWTAEKQRV